MLSRPDFFVDMSGQIPCRQNNGQEINAVMFRPKSKLWVPRWIIGTSCPGKQWRAERQACWCSRLTACFSQTVKHFWGFILSIFCFLNVSFLFQNSTLLCRQNRIFVDMSYFLKIAVLSPILSTKRLSTTALVATNILLHRISETCYSK